LNIRRVGKSQREAGRARRYFKAPRAQCTEAVIEGLQSSTSTAPVFCELELELNTNSTAL
jgi:hypothetical protein